MAKRQFLYFAEADVEEAGDALLIPVDSYLGCDPGSSTTTLFHFADAQGAQTRESVTLFHGTNLNKAVINAMMTIMNSHPHSDGYIVAADFNVANGQIATTHKAFSGDATVTSCAIA
jgi:hypothetical protein